MSAVIRLAHAKGYWVTDEGDVVAPSGAFRKLRHHLKGRDKSPYLCFSVATDQGVRPVYVHRLAAFQRFGEAALEPGVVVRHLDGNSENNAVGNLAIGTQSDNMLDRDPEARRAHSLLAAGKRRKLTGDQARELVNMRRSGVPSKVCAATFGVRESTVSEVLSGKLYSDLTGIPFVPRKSPHATGGAQ